MNRIHYRFFLQAPPSSVWSICQNPNLAILGFIALEVISKDRIHQEANEWLSKAKIYLDQWLAPGYVMKNNHDRISLDSWQQIKDTNHVMKRGNTSGEVIDTLCGNAP